jgi:hypothetical protein
VNSAAAGTTAEPASKTVTMILPRLRTNIKNPYR